MVCPDTDGETSQCAPLPTCGHYDCYYMSPRTPNQFLPTEGRRSEHRATLDTHRHARNPAAATPIRFGDQGRHRTSDAESDMRRCWRTRGAIHTGEIADTSRGLGARFSDSFSR
jgi:hypothetical protein